VGATAVPHAEILDHVRDSLAQQDIDLQIEIFDSFDEPNALLAAGRLHANFFRYLPFLEDFNRRTGNRLVPLVPVHIEPFGLCSASIATIDAIPDYAEYLVARPDNCAERTVRALADALKSTATREFIASTYAGQVLAAF
jgi:D-methionine transport system substrate-binding protein